MENFEYDRVFPFEGGADDDFASGMTEAMINYIHSYESSLRGEIHFLHPLAPAIFKKTVGDCERIAKEFSGRIKAKIDYSRFRATIELWCCYVEFVRGEFMSVLQEISHFAISIEFSPLTSGELHITIEMPYFVPAKFLDKIE